MLVVGEISQKEVLFTGNILSDREWEFLLQIAYRIGLCNSYESFADTLLNQLRAIIPYQKGICFCIRRKNGSCTLDHPRVLCPTGPDFDEKVYMNGNYRSVWTEYVFSPWSSVVRQSDANKDNTWESSRLYQEIWKSQGLHYGLHAILIYDDHPLCLVALLRLKKDFDFTERELYILNSLKNLLALKLFQIIFPTDQQQLPTDPTATSRIFIAAERFGLTKRETEIVRLLCLGKRSEEISGSLFICNSTLRKHIYNIYCKTHVNSRVQLVNLFKV